ncbi:hypothetical protein ACOMHN_011431 [Nucella lapillus]
MLESKEAEVGDLNAATDADSVTKAESDGANKRCEDSSQQESDNSSDSEIHYPRHCSMSGGHNEESGRSTLFPTRELFNAIVYAELFDAENISFVSHENVYSITHDKIHPTGKGAATLARNLGQHLDNVLWKRQRDKRRRPSQPFQCYQPRRGVEESRYHGTYLTGNNINNRVEESRYHGTYHTDNNNNGNEESRYHGTYHTDNNINNRVEESRYHGTYHTDNNNNNRNEESRYTYHTDNNINNRNEESRYHGTYHTDNNINNRDDNPNAGFWLDNPRRYQRRGWWNNGYQQRRRRWDNTVRVPMRDNLSPNRDRRPNGFSFPRKHFYDRPINY